MDSVKMAKLDILSVKNQVLGYSVVALLVIIFMSFISDTFVAPAISCAWVVALYGTIPFMVQEKNDLERFYSTVPLRTKDVVEGRFISTFSLYSFTLLGGLALYLVIALTRGVALGLGDIVTGISISLFVFSLIVGIQTPFFFKLGYTKGRMYSTIPFIALFIIVLLPTTFPTLAYFELVSMLGVYMIPICIVASVAIVLCSYRASINAYKRRR